MSLIQTIIGSAVGVSTPTPLYPPVGYGYPTTATADTITGTTTIAGYYETSSISNPVVGLRRKLYDGVALSSDWQYVQTYPNSMTVIETVNDPYVGFTGWSDINTNFTFEWKGYFKPAVDGDFYFYMYTDDYSSMFIGQYADGLGTNYSVLNLNNNQGYSGKISLLAGKYYPVCILYSEVSGGANCTVMAGLNGQTLYNNQQAAAIGQFYYDDNIVAGNFPATGLIL